MNAEFQPLIDRPSFSLPTTKEPRKDDFDQILSKLGFGRWQWLIIIVVGVCHLLLPVNMLGLALLAGPMPFRCFTQPFQEISANGYLINPTTNTTGANYSIYSYTCLAPGEQEPQIDTNNISEPLPLGRYPTGLGSCPFVEYNTSVFSSTIVSQFHLICERTYLQLLYQMIYNFGAIIGSITGSHISDRFGRLVTVKLGCFMNILAVIVQLVTPYSSVLLFARFMLGVAMTCVYIPAMTIMLESTPIPNRNLVGMMMAMPCAIYLALFGCLGFFIRDWKLLYTITSTPSLALLPMLFLVDESPRWLLQQGRGKEALAIIEKAVRWNRADLPDLPSAIQGILKDNKYNSDIDLRLKKQSVNLLTKLVEVVQQVWVYFQSPGMRTILLVTTPLFFSIGLIYVGIAINANNFADSQPSLYIGLSGIMESLAYLIITPIISCVGRKSLLGGGILITGVMLLLDLLVPGNYGWLKWILVMMGFFCISGATQVSYIYVHELFPTEARSRGVAFTYVMVVIGCACAPLVTIIWVSVSLTDLLKKGSPNKLRWGPAQEEAFSKLKSFITSYPILRTPDFSRDFEVQTDASDRAIGAVLLQQFEAGRRGGPQMSSLDVPGL